MPHHLSIDELCEVMHESYERAAIVHGWPTQTICRVPWDDLPIQNKETTRVAVATLLDWVARNGGLHAR